MSFCCIQNRLMSTFLLSYYTTFLYQRNTYKKNGIGTNINPKAKASGLGP